MCLMCLLKQLCDTVQKGYWPWGENSALEITNSTHREGEILQKFKWMLQLDCSEDRERLLRKMQSRAPSNGRPPPQLRLPEIEAQASTITCLPSLRSPGGPPRRRQPEQSTGLCSLITGLFWTWRGSIAEACAICFHASQCTAQTRKEENLHRLWPWLRADTLVRRADLLQGWARCNYVCAQFILWCIDGCFCELSHNLHLKMVLIHSPRQMYFKYNFK